MHPSYEDCGHRCLRRTKQVVSFAAYRNEMDAPVCAARVALCSTKGRPTKLASNFFASVVPGCTWLYVSICVGLPTMVMSKSESAHVFQETWCHWADFDVSARGKCLCTGYAFESASIGLFYFASVFVALTHTHEERKNGTDSMAHTCACVDCLPPPTQRGFVKFASVVGPFLVCP